MSNVHLTINGKKHRCAFSMLQIENMSKLSAQQGTNIEIGACLPYTAIQMGARQDKKPLDITFEDVLLWYDEAVTEDSEELKALNDAFLESTIYKRIIEPNLTEEQKKSQLTLMKQEPSPQVS